MATTRFLFSATHRAEWVRAGDTCESPVGMRGLVLRIVPTAGGLASVKVKWENGHTGRTTITLLRKVAGSR